MRKLICGLAAALTIAQPLTRAQEIQPTAPPAQEYVLGPDSQRQPGVPQGKVTKHEWTSKIYPGTVRDYWVYVPAQYKPDKPACTMVFQDGSTFVNETGAFKTTIVFDNLIHKGDMPVTIGVFINPGVVPGAGAEHAVALQSQRRIRRRRPALSHVPDRRDSAGSCQAVQPLATIRTTAPSPDRVPEATPLSTPRGPAPTSSIACSASSAASPTCAAIISIRRWCGRWKPSRCACSCRTACRMSTSTATTNWGWRCAMPATITNW